MSDNLVSYILLSKQATGKALESLILQVVESPTIFTFIELLQMPNVQALSENGPNDFVRLLHIFSFGTYQDYLNEQTSLPKLEKVATHKLRKLTLISMATKSHNISYKELLQHLELSTTRELEDLIIESVYASLLKAKLNTATQSVYIESTVGRDLNSQSSIDNILMSLHHWSNTCESVLNDIQQAVQDVKSTIDTKKKDFEAHQSAIEEVKRRVRGNGAGTSNLLRGKRSAGFEQQGDDVMSDAMPDVMERPKSGLHVLNSATESPQASSGTTPINRKRKTPTPKKIGNLTS